MITLTSDDIELIFIIFISTFVLYDVVKYGLLTLFWTLKRTK